MITAETLVAPPDEALAAEIDGEIVIMDVESGAYFNLDPVGAAVWRKLTVPTTVRSLCLALTEEYDAPLEVIQTDVIRLLEQMLELRLIAVTN